MYNSMNSYIIKISCTSKEELSYNNKKISIKNYNKINFENLINATDYIEKALILHKTSILHKKLKKIKFTTKSLEFLCKCTNESVIDLKTFIEAMHTLGYSSSHNTFIYLITINNNDLATRYEAILKYRFQSITEEPLEETIKKRSENKSSYYTQTLYSKN